MPYIELTPTVAEALKEELKTMQNSKENMQKKLFEAIERSIGFDITPKDTVPDEFACVEQLWTVLNTVHPFPYVTYTPRLVEELKKSEYWVGTLDLNKGNIIVNATGTGNGSVVGHCGFIWDNGKIVSNNSKTGKMDTYYNFETWKQRYRIKGGMPTLIFKLK
jgi:hypothetical protein